VQQRTPAHALSLRQTCNSRRRNVQGVSAEQWRQEQPHEQGPQQWQADEVYRRGTDRDAERQHARGAQPSYPQSARISTAVPVRNAH